MPDISASAFLDPGALAVVLAGTLIATIARCGIGEMRGALRELARLVTPRFDEGANQAALARCAAAILAKGHLCAECPLPPDRATAGLVEAYQVSGSFDALHSQARGERTAREIARAQGIRVFEYAGELAPVFGLVGTLFAITQLAPQAGSTTAEVTMAAVATAVLSSLYGVLTAHLACIPLARAIERRGEREEQVRSELLDRFEAMIEPSATASRGRMRDAA